MARGSRTVRELGRSPAATWELGCPPCVPRGRSRGAHALGGARGGRGSCVGACVVRVRTARQGWWERTPAPAGVSQAQRETEPPRAPGFAQVPVARVSLCRHERSVTLAVVWRLARGRAGGDLGAGPTDRRDEGARLQHAEQDGAFGLPRALRCGGGGPRLGRQPGRPSAWLGVRTWAQGPASWVPSPARPLVNRETSRRVTKLRPWVSPVTKCSSDTGHGCVRRESRRARRPGSEMIRCCHWRS